jgi:hypothetical protein
MFVQDSMPHPADMEPPTDTELRTLAHLNGLHAEALRLALPVDQARAIEARLARLIAAGPTLPDDADATAAGWAWRLLNRAD